MLRFKKHFIDHLQTDGFRAYAVENLKGTLQYGGLDTYRKIAFLSGSGQITYDHQVYMFDGAVLLFTRPGISCTWCLSGKESMAYTCAIKDDFLDGTCLGWRSDHNQYFVDNPVLHLASEQEKFVQSIFCRMIADQNTGYAFKTELMQNQICILTHIALRMAVNTPAAILSGQLAPVANVSLELINLGFPAAGQVLHFN